MKHFLLFTIFCLSLFCQAQHLPKLSDLGLVELSSVSFYMPVDGVYGCFNFSHKDGYVVSGSLDYVEEGSSNPETMKMTFSSNPIVMTSKIEQDGGLSFIHATLKDFVINDDGTVKQYTIDFVSYNSRGKETYIFPVNLYYDNDKHLLKIESKFCDIENEWVDGNLSRQIETRKYVKGTYSVISVFSYGQDVNPGIVVDPTNKNITWHLPLEDMGVFGRLSKNLPQSKKYKYSDENITHTVDYMYVYDNQKRITEVLTTTGYKYFKYSNTTSLESVNTQSTVALDQVIGLNGMPNVLTKGIKIIKKSDGTNQIVNVK